jgi:hypothetical protein
MTPQPTSSSRAAPMSSPTATVMRPTCSRPPRRPRRNLHRPDRRPRGFLRPHKPEERFHLCL